MWADRIIDIDSQIWVAGWYAQKTRKGARGAIDKLAQILQGIRENTPANGEFLLLKGEKSRSCFRYEIFPEYKANRPPGGPAYEKEQRYWLINDQAAINVGDIYPDLETDDAVGMYHKSDMDVIVSIDKDLRQYPGGHYNPDKRETEIVTPFLAARNFWVQVLMGDSVDNVRGIHGIGEVKAKAALAGCRTFDELEQAAWRVYTDFAGADKAEKVMSVEATLVWMARPWAMRWEPYLGQKWWENYEAKP